MRPGGDKRGNAEDRRRRKIWLLWAHDEDLGPFHCRCHHCGKRLSENTVTADRIESGGSYRRENLWPSCWLCNCRRWHFDDKAFEDWPHPIVEDDEPLYAF